MFLTTPLKTTLFAAVGAIASLNLGSPALAVPGNQLQWDCYRKSDNEFSFGSHSNVSNGAILCTSNPHFDPTPPPQANVTDNNNSNGELASILTYLFLDRVLDQFDSNGNNNPDAVDPPVIEEVEVVNLSEDCLNYNPANLEIRNQGAQGWLLTDGVSRMSMLDDLQDASEALSLARRHTQHCFIGRNNNRPNRRRYISEYWLGNSGIFDGPVGSDCRNYDPDNLQIVNEGANGWLLTDGLSRMKVLDDRDDAELALAVAQTHDTRCFIGRGNSRPDRSRYIFQYWL